MKSIITSLVAGVVIFVGTALASAQTQAGPAVIHNSRHSSYINALAVAPNGRWLASASSDSTVKLWDLASGRLLRTLTGHAQGVENVAITPDGLSVVSLSEDNTIKVWDAETGKLLRTVTGIVGRNDYVQDSLVVSSDGRSLFSASSQAIRRIDLATGKLKKRYAKLGRFFGQWLAFALSPDNRFIAAAHAGTRASQNNGAQVVLLDAASGKVRRVLGNYDAKESVNSIAFSPDGRMVAVSGNNGTAKVWSTASGRLLHTLAYSETAENRYVNAVRFSPDSRTIVTTGGKEGLKFWDAATGRLLRNLTDKRYAYSNAVAFSPDGRILISASSTDISLSNLANGTPRPTAFGQNSYYVRIAPLDQDRWLAIGSGGLAVWDATSWQLLQTLERKPGGFLSPTPSQFWAKDGSGRVVVATEPGDLKIKLWDVTHGRLLRTIAWTPRPKNEKPCPSCAGYSLSNVTLSPDGRRVAAFMWGDDSETIRVWDVASDKLLKAIATGAARRKKPTDAPEVAANYFAFSTDSKMIVAGISRAWPSKWIDLFEVESGRRVRGFRLPQIGLKSAGSEADNSYFALSPDGKTVAVKFRIWKTGSFGQIDAIATFDLASGRRLHVFRDDTVNNSVHIIRYSPDGRLIFVGVGSAEIVNVWDAATGRLVRTLKGNPGSSDSIEFSPDGRRLVIGNLNGTSSVWDTASFARLAITLHAASGEWVTITPEGFFAASAHGAELLHIVRGFETIGIDQVYQSLYRPDLVREKLAGDPRGLVRQAAARLDLNKVLASGNAPSVRLLSPADGTRAANQQITAEVEIAPRAGGIGRVEWRVNGVTVGVDRPATPPAGQPLRLSRGLALEQGDNAIEVVAYNGANLIASLPARAAVTGPASAAKVQARLFVLALGLNKYADAQFNLTYAVPDAKALAEALRLTGKGLYSAVDVTFLSDAQVKRGELDKAFTELAAKVEPTDLFVFYVAGHGKTVDGRYYFVPQDFKFDGDRSNIAAVNKAVAAQGIAQEQWQAWFARIPARKSVLLFDTCEAGTLTGDATRALERGAANDRMAQATGRTILTASAGDKEALEGFHDHGLFTYSVLEALQSADSNGDGRIDVAELAAYVHAQVTALSEKVFKQRQVPQVRIVSNYPFARPAQVLPSAAPDIVIPNRPTHLLSASAELLVLPAPGARQVRKLDAKTPLTLVRSEGGWTLVASHGRPIGYVATRDLAPLH